MTALVQLVCQTPEAALVCGARKTEEEKCFSFSLHFVLQFSDLREGFSFFVTFRSFTEKDIVIVITVRDRGVKERN